MINIAHVITKLELGGAQLSTLYTVDNLDKKKYRTFLISSRDELTQEAQRIPHVKTVLTPLLRREISPLFDVLCLLYLSFFFLRHKIEIVHTHSSKAGILGRWAAKLTGVAVIIHTIHGYPFHPYQNPLLRSIYIFLERITAKITDSLVAICRSDISKGLRNKIGKKEKYVLIRDGIQRELFSPLTSEEVKRKKRQVGIPENSPVVGMVACFKRQKSPLDFIKVASLIHKKIPSSHFVLVGEGTLRRSIEKLIRKENLASVIKLLGWRRDINELIPIFDVCVLTSYWEGLPKFLLEAMACGKPVVSTNVDGIKEIIKDGINGFLLEPGNIQGMAEKIAILLEDEKRREEMGRAGSELLTEEFNIKNMVKQLEILYQRCYNQKTKVAR